MSERQFGQPSAEDLRALAELGSPVLSLLVSVTAAVPDATQNALRHARSVARGVSRLRELGEDALAAEAERALEAFANSGDAPHPAVRTRAAYWAPGARPLLFGLPFALGECVALADAARLRPVARAARLPGRYRVLVLSANHVALYAGDADRLEPESDTELPRSLEDALGRDLTAPSLQFHSTSGQGDRPAYHGHGGAPAGRRVDLERFYQRVARALEPALVDDPVPLVLAADAAHRPGLEKALRREVGLLPRGLEGNFEHLDAAALQRETWPIASAATPSSRALLDRARAGGRRLVSGVDELLRAAVMGRVHRLWTPERGAIGGRLDAARLRVAPPRADDDLVDALAAEVLRRGGELLVLEDTVLEDEPAELVAELR